MSTKSIVLLDLLCTLHPDTPRERLMAAIVCGDIKVNDETVRDPKVRVSLNARIDWLPERPVGRGYDKLQAALETFVVECYDQIVLDAGSSTGGFTQRLLDSGARSVYAVDVGRNQLAWRLRIDSRVFVMEETNVLAIGSDDLQLRPDFAVCDLSFRSLRQVAAHIARLTRTGRLIALAKPQFEGATGAGFDGVVSDSAGKELIEDLISDLTIEGLRCDGKMPSVLRGRKGNQEFFLDLRLGTTTSIRK